MNYVLLFFLTLGLYSISNKINKKILKNQENIIINTFIFSFLFVLIYLFNSYLFVLNIDSKYFSYLFLLVCLVICFFEKSEIFYYLNLFKRYFITKNKIILLILFAYFLTILLPPADEDSLRYHLEIAKKINNGSFYSNTWFDYIAIGAHEFINSFALHLKFENISSYTNFVFLSFAILSNIFILKKYKQGSGILSGIILLSCPYLIALISSQKFYFFPCYIVSYSIAYLYLEKKINLLTINLIITLNIFCVIIKPIFLPYLALISLWMLFKKIAVKNRVIYVFALLIISIILYYPIFLIKLKIYNDPFLPYFSINNTNSDWLKVFNYYFTNFNMDYTDGINNLFIKYLLIPLKLVIPLQPSDFFKTLGLGLLFIFSLNYKKNKNLLILISFFIIAVILLQNFQTRWFLPLFIFLSIFANINKFNFLKKTTYAQLLGISCILIPMGLTTMFSNIGIINKKFILDKVFQSHEMITYINKNFQGEKIFSKLNYFYYFDNVVPIYYPQIVNKFEPNFYKKNEHDVRLILWNNSITKSEEPNSYSAQMDLPTFVNNNFTCKKLTKIREFEVGVGRNFLNKNNNKNKFYLFRLSC